LKAKEYQFEGIAEGEILGAKKLELEGFGYDPIFSLKGFFKVHLLNYLWQKKMKISHRGIASSALDRVPFQR